MKNQKSKFLLVGVYKLLARRARSEKEVIDWLSKKNTPEEVQREIIARLYELKLLDDLSFAQSFIRTRMLLKPRSIRVLKLELSQKGIAKEVIAQALQSIEVDEKKVAQEVYEKNLWRWKKYDEKVAKLKARDFLMRRGFGFDVISSLHI